MQLDSYAEIITTGDELNQGAVVDTNAAWLATELTRQGWKVRFRQGVNDQPEDIQAALVQASSRAVLVLMTGGLGPTEDDCTVEVVCNWLQVPPVVDAHHEQRLVARMAGRPTDIQRRQVRIPQGVTVLENPVGTAPGFAFQKNKAHVLCFPGIPQEMKAMFQQAAWPYIQNMLPQEEPYHAQVFRVFGLSESQVCAQLQDIVAPLEEMGTLHYRWSFPEVVLTWMVPHRWQQEVTHWVAEIQQRLAPYVYSQSDKTLPEVVVQSLIQKKETVALAESCTGGWVGQLLTSVPGASACFVGGVMAYHRRAKERVGVSAELIDQHGEVSEACARAMAVGVREQLQTTYGIAITGIAGPDGGTPTKPVGTVYLALASAQHVRAHQVLLRGDREQIRLRAAWLALDLLHQEAG